MKELTFNFPDMDSDARLREIVLYVSAACRTAPRFGAVKLNKIIMAADFTSFVRTGRPITGSEYMRQNNGPVPRRMKAVLVSMERDGDIAIEHLPAGGNRIEDRVIPLRNPAPAAFSPDELGIINEAIRFAWPHSGTTLSDWSHGKAWLIAEENGELIPYEATYLSDRPFSEYEIARTHELNRRFGWEYIDD